MGDVDRTLLARRQVCWQCACGSQNWNLKDMVTHIELRCSECDGEPCFPDPIVLKYRKPEND
jgi:hypothetical protein